MAKTLFETLNYDVEDNIATITLDRPEKLNAFNIKMMDEIRACFDLSDADDEVKAVILTGAGRAFCSGSDLTPAPGAERPVPADPNEVRPDSAGRVTLRIFDSTKPVICAVNGAAVGVGVTMQLACDIRIASTTARFGLVFSQRGIVMEGASSWFLPKIVGVSTTLDWCYSGRIFPAQEALDSGLVRSLHAPEELIPAAREIAKSLFEKSAPVSAALTRQMVWRASGAAHPMEAHIAESRALHHRFKSADSKEGVMSFLEKRPAAFADRVSEMPDIWADWVAPKFHG